MNKAIVDRMPKESKDCQFSRFVDGEHICLLRLI